MSRAWSFQAGSQPSAPISDIDHLTQNGYLDHSQYLSASQRQNQYSEVYDPYEEYYPYLDGDQAAYYQSPYPYQAPQPYYSNPYQYPPDYSVAQPSGNVQYPQNTKAHTQARSFFLIIFLLVSLVIAIAFLIRINSF